MMMKSCELDIADNEESSLKRRLLKVNTLGEPFQSEFYEEIRKIFEWIYSIDSRKQYTPYIAERSMG